MRGVVVAAKIENLADLYRAQQGRLANDQVRHLEVQDAVADTETLVLTLPTSLIEPLGLGRYKTQRVRTPAGVVQRGVYEAVRLTVQGRCCTFDVLDGGEDGRVRIGRLPLMALDLVIDPINRKLIDLF
jgi:hypothetical protein